MAVHDNLNSNLGKTFDIFYTIASNGSNAYTRFSHKENDEYVEGVDSSVVEITRQVINGNKDGVNLTLVFHKKGKYLINRYGTYDWSYTNNEDYASYRIIEVLDENTPVTTSSNCNMLFSCVGPI